MIAISNILLSLLLVLYINKIVSAVLEKKLDGINPALMIPSNFLPIQKDLEGFSFCAGFFFCSLPNVSFISGTRKSNKYWLSRTVKILNRLTTSISTAGILNDKQFTRLYADGKPDNSNAEDIKQTQIPILPLKVGVALKNN